MASLKEYKPIKLIKAKSKYGRVYLAQRNDNLFVVKEFYFTDYGKLAFEKEKNIDFSFVPELVDVFIDNNKGIIIRRFIKHKTLIELCKTSFFTKKNKLITKCIKIFIKILSIVAMLHKKNIIHNDLKPSNILIENETNSIYLIDFAMSKIPNIDIGNMPFSLIFSPPEHIFKFWDLITFDTDLYILSLTFWMALNNGKLPYYHENPEILINMQLNMPLPIGKLDKQMYKILNKGAFKTSFRISPRLMEKTEIYNHIYMDKTKRFSNVYEMQTELAKYLVK